MLRRRGVEQDARRLLRLRAKNHYPRRDFVCLARHAIHIEHAASLVAFRVHQYLVDHGVRNQRAVTRCDRIRNGGESRVEVRMRDTPALAWTAVVARPASVEWAREIGGACKCGSAAE